MIGSFFGRDQAKDLAAGKKKSDKALKAAYGEASGELDNALTKSVDYLQPGIRANALYGDAIGAGGEEGYGRAMSTYDADPFRKLYEDETSRAVDRTFKAYNAGGMGDSGLNRLAVGRVGGDFARRDVADFRDRLAGYGVPAATTAADYTYQTGGTKAGLRYGYGQQQAGQETNYANAQAANRSTGINNLLSVAGTAAKFFAPVPGK